MAPGPAKLSQLPLLPAALCKCCLYCNVMHALLLDYGGSEELICWVDSDCLGT